MAYEPYYANKIAEIDEYLKANNMGLKYRDETSCPRTLVGKRCQLFRAGHIGNCLCSPPAHLNDHGARYKDTETGESVIMWEPYDILNPQALIDVINAAKAEGISVEISSHSPWYPGHTVAIVFRKAK